MIKFLLGFITGPVVIALVVIGWGDEIITWLEARTS